MQGLRLPKKREIVAPARFWKRLIAFIADLMIIDIVLLSPFTNYFTTIMPLIEKMGSSSEIPAGLITALTLIGIIVLLYFTLTEYLLGMTPGMQLFRLRIKGERTMINCIIRNLYALPVFPFTILWVVDPIYLIMKDERVLERITKTSTVETITI